jgi:hypothetical protein
MEKTKTIPKIVIITMTPPPFQLEKESFLEIESGVDGASKSRMKRRKKSAAAAKAKSEEHNQSDSDDDGGDQVEDQVSVS